MLSIPLIVFLGLYLLFLLIFFLFSAANVYHLFSTGTFTPISLFITAITTIWCVIILTITVAGMLDVDWGANLVLFGNDSIISFEKPYAPGSNY